MSRAVAPGYGGLARAAHWTILLLCIAQFPTSAAIHRTHAANPFGLEPAPVDLFLHQVHAWAGWTAGGLAAVLLAHRLLGRSPALPQGMASWQRKAALAGHLLLYGCLAGLVVTGTMTMYLTRAAAPIHSVLTWIGIALVAAHSVAAVWHEVVRRDGLLGRMLP
jgi:cytochrome b561